MKRIACIIIICCALSGRVYAATTTEGMLDIERIGTEIQNDLSSYADKKTELIDDIKLAQDSIRGLKDAYARAEENERPLYKAETLKETSRLLDLYSQYYNQTITTINTILPNLERMRKSARKGSLGKSERLRSPEFRKNLLNLYSTASQMALKFGSPATKAEIASLLNDSEILYKQSQKGGTVFQDVLRNIDKVEEHLRSLYAKTKLRNTILETQKMKTEIAVSLMQYALALKPLKEGTALINDGMLEIPDIDFDEVVDSIIEPEDDSMDTAGEGYSDPDVDAVLLRHANNNANR